MAYNKTTGLYEGYIYKITNLINQHSYIGQTYRTIKLRWNEHKRDYKKHKYALYSAMKMYGLEHFSIEQVEKISCYDVHELLTSLNEREVFWIDFYDTYRNGYNETIGGQNNAPNKFDEVPVIEYDMDFNELYRYNSATDAAFANGFSRSDISSCCSRKKVYRVHDRIFRYVTSPLTEEEKNAYRERYPKIYQYDFYGNLIRVYNFVYEAVDWFAEQGVVIDSGNIAKCCNGKVLSALGYVWRKFPDAFATYRTPVAKRIECRDIITGKLVCVYNNFDEIRDYLHVDNITSVHHCCSKHNASAYGYHWCYEGEFDFSELKRVHKQVINKYYENMYSTVL
jgi:hypothetical protein